ncbi:MAG: AsmA-like C-terminal region-containing protein, partial [Hyphomicrobiaceae bacterium]
ADKAGKAGKPGAGMELDAEIDNVIGHGEVSLRGLKLKMSRRAEKLAFLEARGTLDGGGAVAISMVPEAGQPRRLLADTTDAGQAFRLIGFYPNMQVGRGRMEVNVDGRGPAEKTGTVWVEDFKILGDPVVSEVLGSAPDAVEAGKPVRRAKKAAQREVIDFDRMKIPFSVGYGQFVIENAYLRGPVLGVSLVGKADFKLQSLNLGGTYIPLQGLNNVLGGVPLIGNLVSGVQGDGVFGITFAVQGPMSQPQVLVNPLSLLAPSFTREFFQMTNQNPKVIPRDEKGPTAPVEKRVRASSSPGEAGQGKAGGEKPASGNGGAAGGADAGGWVSQTAPAKKK